MPEGNSHCILITTDFPPDRGGIQRCLSSIYETFPPGCLTVIAPYTRGAREFDFKQKYIIKRAGRFFPFFGRKARLLLFLLSSTLILFFEVLKKKLKGKNVVIHSGHIIAGIPALISKKILGTSYLQWTYAIEVMTKKRQWIIKMVLRNAEVVLTISTFTEEYIRKIIPAGKIKKIRLPLPPLKAPPDEIKRKICENLKGKKLVLTVARLSSLQRYKGIDMTVMAFKKVKERIPDAVYVVLGDGDARRDYERMAESLGIAEKVIFRGEVTDEELSAWYSACDLFVMPSRIEENERGIFAEGFGLVFLEANSFGKPVIGGEGGCRDAVIDGKTGFILNPRDPDEIAEKILYLLQNPEVRRKMGEEGKKWAESVKPEDIRDYLMELI